jgi:peptidoglycan/LPS O-acetylase OafA/YrhL
MHRNRFLDVTRLVAAVLVMLHHLPPGAIGDSKSFAAVVRGGYCGVDLFFVLSGFLISGLLFSEYDRYGDIQVSRFLVRRAFKLYPAFWAMVGATVIGRMMFSPPEVLDETWSRLVAELLFVQNYFPGLWSHTWSLAVEEHFYLFLPCSMACMIAWNRRGDPFRWMPPLFAMTAAGCLVLRSRLPPSQDEADWFLAAGTHLRVDSLMFGVLLRWGIRRFPMFERLGVGSAIGLLLLGALLMSFAFVSESTIDRLRPTWGPTVLYLGAGCIVLASLGINIPANGPLSLVARAGADSYSIYLWHLFVFKMFERPLATASLPPWLDAFSLIGASVLVGVVMSRLVEQPALRLRDRYFPSRSSQTTTPGAWPGVSGRKLGI